MDGSYTDTTIIDPDAIDSLLVKEMNRLSFQERNDIQEEIHGVRTGASEETQQLIEQGLRQIVEELLKLPASEKNAYLRARQLAKQQQRSPSYTDKPDFYLRFLRTDLWNAKKAAKRLVMFLDLLLELYGEYALQRPIQMADFTDAELKEIKCGQIQLLPFRDRSGRRVLALVSNLGFDMDPKSKVRTKWLAYLAWVVSEDVETQRKGVIVLMFPGDNAMETFLRLPSAQDTSDSIRMQKCFPYRFAAAHCCVPDAPLFHMLRAIAVITSIDEIRLRIRFSMGTNMELQYQLLGYGIPVSTIPLTDTGTVKTKQLFNWIKTRRAIEDTWSSEVRSPKNLKEYIDCPLTIDVVFRNGTASLVHPGNVKFRELIVLHYQEHQQAKSSEEKKAVSWKIVHQVNDTGGRFLEWDQSKGCWTPMLDPSQIRVKVARTLRDFKKVVEAARNSQNNASSTYRFERQDGKKRQRTGEMGEDEMCGGFCG